MVIPYLLSADILNTILSATLTFAGRVLYPSYAQTERITSLTPLQDQIAAGAEMWILNSLMFLIPPWFLPSGCFRRDSCCRIYNQILPDEYHSCPGERHGASERHGCGWQCPARDKAVPCYKATVFWEMLELFGYPPISIHQTVVIQTTDTVDECESSIS